MSDMTRRERILAASRGQRADGLPFLHYWRHCQTGWAVRESRNRGMGLCWVRPCAAEILHGVETEERQVVLDGRSVVRRTYVTPVGTVTMAERRDPGTGQWHAQRSWRPQAVAPGWRAGPDTQEGPARRGGGVRRRTPGRSAVGVGPGRQAGAGEGSQDAPGTSAAGARQLDLEDAGGAHDPLAVR